MSLHHEAVGGNLWTRPYKLLVAVGALGLLLIAWRFSVGLGPATGLTDGYPWGLWIAFDVVTGTALGLRRLRRRHPGLHPQQGPATIR